MRGIRILNLKNTVEVKQLKVYFSNPENNGGAIETIYYPLTNNDAVVIFEKAEVVDRLLSTDHCLKSSLTIRRLPENQIFMSMEAKLGSEVSALILATPELQDQIKYGESIQIIYSEAQTSDQMIRLRGNWFQLEWAWHFLDCLMQHQEIIQSNLTQQGDGKSKTRSLKPFYSANGLGQFVDPPMSLEQSGDSHRSMKPSDDLHLSMGLLSLSSQETRKDHTQSEQMGDDGSRRLDNGFTKSHHDDIVADKQQYQSLKENISASYRSTDEADTDDELRGVGYQIPSGSLSMTQTFNSKPHRHKDENDTFEKFSSMRSDRKVAEESSRRQNSEHSSAFSGAHGTEDYKRGLSDSREDPYFSSLPVDLNDVKPSSHAMNVDDILKKYSFRKSESYTKQGLNSSLSPTDDMADMRPIRREAPEARHSTYDSKFQHSRSDKGRLGSSVKQAPLQSSYSTDELSFKTDIKGIQVAIYHGSLLEEDTGAIVNAANEQLDHYGGIAYAIAKARGPEINTECRKYITEHGSLKKTEAMSTSGGGQIKADYIIHAAGPMYIWKETFHQELTRTFLNCFRLAENLLVTSIAVPAISTGVYGAPLDECIKSFIDAVLLFSQEQKRLTDIRMLNNDAENAVTSIVLMKTILEAPIDQLMKHALASNSGESHRDLNIPRGRRERSGSFSRTYSKLPDKADTAISSKSSTSHRSSSHSRVTDLAAKEDKHKPTSYEKSGYSAEGMRASPRDSHNTNRTEPRQHGSSRSSHSSNVPDRKSPFNRSSSSLVSDKSSSVRLSTMSTAGKTTPHIKPSLTDTGKLKAKTYRSSPSDYTASKLALYSSDITGPNSSKHRSKESRYDDDDENDMDFGMRSLPANLHSETYRERFLNISSSEKADVCAICLSEVTMPKELEKCKHKFCTDCIDQHFRMSKPTCPTCGAIYGAIVGDQPRNGRMEYQTKRDLLLPGYEKEDGAIVITYTFPSGKQDSSHPIPGQPYKGMERKAYLPNSREGREILRLLQKAFDARLMFTIGMSRTTGKEGVLTWNDIHHKTSIHGGPVKFGYPDPDYLRRVRDELAAKGIVSSRY